MDETMNKLDMAYKNLMKISVAGVNVEPMAAALHLMRDVFMDLDAMKKNAEAQKVKEGANDGQTDRN